MNTSSGVILAMDKIEELKEVIESHLPKDGSCDITLKNRTKEVVLAVSKEARQFFYKTFKRNSFLLDYGSIRRD